MKVQNCLRPIRRELHYRNCGLSHLPAEEIVRSQWQSRTKSIYYLIYRWLVAIFFIACVSVSMSFIQNAYDFGMYMIYLTNWGIWACMLTGVYGAVLVTVWYLHPEFADGLKADSEMPMSFKVYWAFHNTAMTLAFVITIIYWGILHSEGTPVDARNVLTHACNSAIMFLDVLIAAHPIRLYHVYQSLLMGLVFTLFSVFYYIGGGTDRYGNHFIYFVLDWSKPEGALTTAVGVIVLAIICHTAIFGVYKLRVFIHDVSTRKNMVLPTSSEQQPTSPISMVLGSGYSNNGFKGSTEVI